MGNCRHYTILAPGFAKWWGSDARALAQAFRHLGHHIIDIDAEDYVPWRWDGVAPKVLRRLFGSVWVKDYNRAVIKQAKASAFDFVLVFKGSFLQRETISVLRSFEKPVYNFYPDVSFTDHDTHIPTTLQYYDCVFSTKSFHGNEEKQSFGIKEFRYVRHGYDSEVHRPISLSTKLTEHYGCDISFVGCWSPEKEEKILYILKHCKDASIKVYGIGWKYASTELKKRLGANLKSGVFGDELAIVYRASKVNLGLLSRAAGNPSVGDQSTARTFQIPATKSFMLHEDTVEVRTLFQPEEEILLFSSNAEMVEQIKRVLSDDELRIAIAKKGYVRCTDEPYDYSDAARKILNHFETTRSAKSL